MPKLDTTDLAILKMLQTDARLTIKEIAAQLSLSTTPVFERIKRLDKQGVIEKYVAVLNQRLLGKKLIAFVDISMKDHGKEAIEGFVDVVIDYPEVLECHHVTGESDFHLKVVIEDIEMYNHFVLNKLSTVPNIGKVESRFSLSERKQTNVLDLDLDLIQRGN